MTTAQTLNVGDAATITGWSDRHACTVEKVSKSGKTAWLRQDRAALLNGADSGEEDALVFTPGGFAAHVKGKQRYAYERNPEGRLYKVTLRGNGQWKQVGVATRERGGNVLCGVRAKHYDYNF